MKTEELVKSAEKIDWTKVEMMDLKIRPWIKINGVNNRKILDYMVISLLNHTMSNPGSKLAKIADHFQPALQPFHTRELAEMLLDLKCVKLQKLPKPEEKCSLFSKPKISETQNADILDEATDIIVEPVTDAMLKLATFINHPTKHLVCPCHTETD